MAYYDDRRHNSTRDRYQPPSDYEQDPYYHHDSRSHAPSDVIRPRDGYSGSADDLHRNYPPPSDYGYEYGYGYPPNPRPSRVATVQETGRRPHSLAGGRGGSYYADSEYAYPRSRHERRSRYDGDQRDRHRKYSRSPSGSRSPPRRRKSFSEQALGALGLGGAASSGSSRRRDRDYDQGRHSGRHRSDSYSRSRSRSRDRNGRHRDKSEQRIAQAVRAALTAGAVEAFHIRKEPGDWAGAKGKRILTAAITAAGTDGLVDRNPKKHSKRHIVESTLAGLAANHFVNGPRSRSRSKSRGRSGNQNALKKLAATGALAAVGKEAYERFRSRSRPRHRDRSSSRDSYDEGSPRPRPSHKRSKSVTDYINQGMQALGLSEKDKGRDSERDRRKDDRRGSHRGRPSRYSSYSDSDGDSDYEPRRGRHSRDVGRPRSIQNMQQTSSAMAMSGAPHYSPRGGSDKDSSSDLGNSTDEEKTRKKLNRQTLVSTGLATVATIHAAHELHGSMEKRKKRMQMVKEGEMTPEEARRRRIKANLTDAASIGIAALGIKGAVNEWQEADEKRKERAEFKRRCAVHHARRQERQRTRSQSDASPGFRSSWPTIYPNEVEEKTSSSGHSRQVRSPSVGADSRSRSSYWA